MGVSTGTRLEIDVRLGRLVLGGLLLAGAAPADEVRVGGYLKTFFTALDAPASGEPTEGIGLTRLRLNLSWHPGENSAAEFAYTVAPRLQSTAGAEGGLPRPAPLSYRAADVRARLYPAPGDRVGSFLVRQNLDRAYFVYSMSFVDLQVGRQPIAFGAARVLNPTDLLAPFTYEELDKEERAGVDALRLRAALGARGEVDVGMVLGDGLKMGEGAFFARGSFYVRQTDWTLMAVVFKENVLLGFDAARSLGGAGTWLEAGYALAGATNDYRSEENYLRLSTGLDYSFGAKSYSFVEYHFNGAGADAAADYLSQLGQTAYAQGTVYLLGRHYLSSGFSYQITPLLAATAQVLVNAGDGSAFISPRCEYSLVEDVFIEFGTFLGTGASLATKTGRPRSEFGLYPRIYFSSMRFYF
jgi:hypothetical protein